MSRIRNLIALVEGQLWILPAFITALAAGLAYLVLTRGADLLGPATGEVWWLYSGDADTARGLLSSFLSGLITMTSLIVSVTFVILTLAANQLGPRLIGVFVRDREIQFVLGLFLGTILYLIIVFRTLDDTLGAKGVPHLAVTVASALTIACLFALLFYIHKIARSIIADNVVEIAAGALRSDLRQILRSGPKDGEPGDVAERPQGTGYGTALGRSGYIQVIDYDELVRIAKEADVVLDVRVRAGHYIMKSGDHVVAYRKRLDDRVTERVRAAFTVAAERTPAQDPEHGIRQLVEIALRALSPGINDQFTAIAVIDRLGGALEEVFERPLQRKHLRDAENRLRVVADRSDIEGLLDAAFNSIRQAGAELPGVLIRVADTLGKLAPAVDAPRPRAALLHHLGKLRETVIDGRLIASDRGDVLDRVAAAESTLLKTGSARA